MTYKVERLACSKPVSDRQPHLWGLLLLLRQKLCVSRATPRLDPGETRDTGPRLANSTVYCPWVPALAPATPKARRRRACNALMASAGTRKVCDAVQLLRRRQPLAGIAPEALDHLVGRHHVAKR